MSWRPQIPHRATLLLPMLGATIDTEVIATRDAIVRTLAAVGLDLHDLAAAITSRSECAIQATTMPTPPFFDMARACRDLDCGRLSPAEKRFVGDMIRAGRASPTARQAAWLLSIFAKLDGRAAA